MYNARIVFFVTLTKKIKIHFGYPKLHVANRQPVLDGYTRDVTLADRNFRANDRPVLYASVRSYSFNNELD